MSDFFDLVATSTISDTFDNGSNPDANVWSETDPTGNAVKVEGGSLKFDRVSSNSFIQSKQKFKIPFVIDLELQRNFNCVQFSVQIGDQTPFQGLLRKDLD